jgi:serine/threonine protein kinase
MLTKTGHIVGTVGWLAPEQITNDAYSVATDVHAWGLCVLFAGTGENPYASLSSGAALYKIVHETPTAPPNMPRRLARMVEQSLAKDPLQRPELSSIIDYLQAPYDETEDLDAEAWRQPATPRTAPRSRGMLVGSLVAIGVGVGAGIAVGRLLAGG